MSTSNWSSILSKCIECKCMGPSVIGTVFIRRNSISQRVFCICNRKGNGVRTLRVKCPKAKFESPFTRRFMQSFRKSISIWSSCKKNRNAGCSWFSRRICMKSVLKVPSKGRSTIAINFPSVRICRHRHPVH